MAQTGQPGGRQSLENKRIKGDIHSKVGEVGNAKSMSIEANASTLRGSVNTNRNRSGK